jgi:hypothetical protein
MCVSLQHVLITLITYTTLYLTVKEILRGGRSGTDCQVLTIMIVSIRNKVGISIWIRVMYHVRHTYSAFFMIIAIS